MGTDFGTIWQQIRLHRSLIALAIALTVALAYLLLGAQRLFVQIAICSVVIVTEAVLDALYMRLYHRLSLVVALLGIITGVGLSLHSPWDVAAGAGIFGGLLLLLFLFTGKLGFGDVCYGTALGTILGAEGAAAAFLLTFWLGLSWAVGSYLAKLAGRFLFEEDIAEKDISEEDRQGEDSLRREAVPLGPFMAAGSLISMIYGKELMAWYLQGLGLA